MVDTTEAEASLRATCAHLLRIIGSRLEHWSNVQIITQRNAEASSLNTELSEVLVRNSLPAPLSKQLPKKLRYYDIYVGERVCFTRRWLGLSADMKLEYIYKSTLCTIDSIADGVYSPAAKKTHAQFRPLVNNVASTDASYAPQNASLTRRVTFTDGSSITWPLDRKKEMGRLGRKVLRRGLCATTSSMQGSEELLIILYVRPGVSRTFDRSELYTGLTRMQRRVIVVSTPHELQRICATDPPRRNNHFQEFLSGLS